MATRGRTGGWGGVFDALRVDLRRFHDRWMGLAYPRQVDTEDSVLGRYRPDSPGRRLLYRLWALAGAVAVAALYPLALVGVVVRFQVRRVAAGADWLGVFGVLLAAAGAWGLLSLLARVRFSGEGFLAVVAAGSVATAAAGGAVVAARVDGRATTVLVAYPLAVTGVFLPPVVAALYSPLLARVVFPHSDSVAIWLLDEVLAVVGLAAPLRRQFDLVGVGYVLLWTAVSVPVGWLLGGLVTLADVARPR